VTIDNCYDRISDIVSDQYAGTALARSERWVREQWWQAEGGGHTTMSGQRRVALERASRVLGPDLHRLITATAGQLANLAPCHRPHPVIVRSQHTNHQKQKGKKLTFASARSPSTGKSFVCEFFTFLFFEDILISTKVTFWSGCSHRTLRQEHDYFCYFSSMLIKKTYAFE